MNLRVKWFSVVGLALAALVLASAPVSAQTDNETLPLSDQIRLTMQDHREDINSSVQDRVFEMDMERSQNRSQVAQERVERLHNAVRNAQQERERLLAKMQNGTIDSTEFAREMAKVNSQISRTARSMEHVENSSRRLGLEVNASEGLDEPLRKAVRDMKHQPAANRSALNMAQEAHQLAQKARSGNMTGQEIARFARNLGVDKADIGPPEGVPGNGAGPANGGGPGMAPGNGNDSKGGQGGAGPQGDGPENSSGNNGSGNGAAPGNPGGP